MKDSMQCPKCRNTEILTIPGELLNYGAGNNIITSNGLGLFIDAVKVTRYLCTQCGFSEEWIDSKSDIEKLQKKFG